MGPTKLDRKLRLKRFLLTTAAKVLNRLLGGDDIGTLSYSALDRAVKLQGVKPYTNTRKAQTSSQTIDLGAGGKKVVRELEEIIHHDQRQEIVGFINKKYGVEKSSSAIVNLMFEDRCAAVNSLKRVDQKIDQIRAQHSVEKSISSLSEMEIEGFLKDLVYVDVDHATGLVYTIDNIDASVAYICEQMFAERFHLKENLVHLKNNDERKEAYDQLDEIDRTLKAAKELFSDIYDTQTGVAQLKGTEPCAEVLERMN